MSLNYARLLEGKKVLITSGAHGMGFAIAKIFVKHGADVAVCGRSPSGADSEAELRKTSPDSFFFKCDVSVPEQLDAFCAEALSRFGYVDVIVNNVGINMREPSPSISYDKYDLVQDTNFKPIIRINNNLLPTLIKQGRPGSLIHISTVHAIATVPLMGSYVASKGAMGGMNRLLAVELGRYGIRSNVVAPGGIYTGPGYNMVVDWMKENPGKSYKQEVVANMPADPLHGDGSLSGGSGRAEDIAHACLFFASDMSSYISGMHLMVDGGASYQAHKVREMIWPENYEEMVREFRMSFPYPEPGDAIIENTSYKNPMMPPPVKS
ncbi:MAG: SDR family oxidoreductase [Oscillospiraceae bacterium]|nr:SDR family oxidoreductase [Oscillospiraceae bacterium]